MKRFLLAENTIDTQDVEALVSWLKGNPWLTQGELVKEFESAWSKWLGTQYSVLVNSGSSANLIMYYAALVSGQLANNKIVVPAIGWATTVAPAIQFGFEPIMCDADPDNYCLDMAMLERLCEEHRPGAVILVHVLGTPAHMERLLALREKYGFMLMEDCCAAHGSTYDGKKVGSFGDMSTFSFFFGHHMSTIEGGVISTDDEDLYHFLLMCRSHGWAKDLPAEKEAELAAKAGVSEFNRRFTFYIPGFNVRSTDLNAFIGLGQLKKLDHVVARRAENHKIYRERFSAAAGFHCQSNPRGVTSSISFVALAPSAEDRDRIGETLAARGIETRPLGGGNMSRQPFWAERYGQIELPMADRIHDTAFHLPNHPGISVEDVETICDVVLGAAVVA